MSSKNDQSNGIQAGFVVPEGYVLVEKAVYELLLEKAKGSVNYSKNDPSIRLPIYLRVVRQFYLGDVKMNLSPGEVIEYRPRYSITVKGKEERKLDSFLVVWNKQDPKSVKYDCNFLPVFEVFEGNIDDLGDGLESVNESQRIYNEENFGDAATKKSNGGIQGLEFVTTPQPKIDDNLPPRGSEARKQLIVERGIDRLEDSAKKAAGLTISGPQKVEDFKVTQPVQNTKIVSKIPGPSAEDKTVKLKG